MLEYWNDERVLNIFDFTPHSELRIPQYRQKEVRMEIKWYGHSAFLITSDQGVKIITDPYESGAYGGQLSYGKIKDKVDIALTSHDHADHNDTKSLPGSPQIVKGSGSKTIKGISFKGIGTYHDSSKGSERGTNTIFTFSVDGIQICHLGDLGHILSEKELAEIGPVDLLLIPVGGYFTIDPKEATRVAEQIHPKVLIPMHFKTEKCGFPIAPVEDFLKGKTNSRRLKANEVAFSKATLPQQMDIVVLEHAL
jgi:L-ascorbate metabolism protein UlaG (beta-lactamase superfamily)